MIVAYLPLLLPLHYAMWRTQLTKLEYQQSSMQSHLQAPQGNCNEDLTSFPFKGNKKEAEKPLLQLMTTR